MSLFKVTHANALLSINASRTWRATTIDLRGLDTRTPTPRHKVPFRVHDPFSSTTLTPTANRELSGQPRLFPVFFRHLPVKKRWRPSTRKGPRSYRAYASWSPHNIGPPHTRVQVSAVKSTEGEDTRKAPELARGWLCS